MADPEIRPAEVDDADRLAAVYRDAYRENRRLGFPAKAESATAETVADWIREHHVLVATVDDEVVGGVRLSVTDPDRVKLSRLAVREARKGEGIGGALVDAAEAWVRETDCGTVWLTTPGEHPFLPEFYRSRGYEKTGDYPLEYRDYDEIRMAKDV